MSNKKYLSFEKRTDNPAEYKELTNSLTDTAYQIKRNSVPVLNEAIQSEARRGVK